MESQGRIKRRLDVSETDNEFGGMRTAYAVWEENGNRHLGKVVDISETGVHLSFQGELEAFPAEGVTISDLFIGTARVNVTCRRLTTRYRSADENGEISLRLEAPDAEGRASLWTILHELETIKQAEEYQGRDAPENFPRIPGRGHYSEEARLERLEFARGLCGEELQSLESTNFDAEKLTGNIENFVGSVELPVGLAGPLWFNGDNVKGLVYAPLGTSEGALVASCTRGATAISKSGGVRTRVLRQRMMRVPSFELTNTEAAMKFRAWVLDHVEEIREQTRLVSRHARLTEVVPNQVGKRINVTFGYQTGDAAGQNMTTVCTWKACQWIMDEMKHFPDIVFENFYIEGSNSGDKKVNFQSFLLGRGTHVTAECFIDNETCRQILKCEPKVLAAGLNDAMAGSVGIGMMGFNINIANVIAAIFTATGQDIACVHECSIGQFRGQAQEDGLSASMELPALIVGTVGGGTSLANQRDYLSLIGCAGPRRAGRLAEIIAGFCLALDLSTSSAIASGQFASAHDRLGRNRPVKWFSKGDLTPKFFEPGFKRIKGEKVSVTEVGDAEFELGSSIITELTARQVKKLVGLFPKRVSFDSGKGQTSEDVLVKIKPLDTEVMLVANGVAQLCGGQLAAAHKRFQDRVGFKGCHIRELELYRQDDERFRKYSPVIYECHRNDEREAFVIVMEKLSELELMNSADDISGWTPEHIEAAINGIGELHSIWLGREDELSKKEWIGHVMDAPGMIEMMPLWESLGVHAWNEFPEWFEKEHHLGFQRAVKSIPRWWSELDSMPKTLVHNDFSPRNLGFRREQGKLRLCAYDWEMATIHIPQRDLVELLAFVLDDTASAEEVERYVELHRQSLSAASGTELDREMWFRGYRLALGDFAVNRVAYYLMGHTFRNYKFLERVVRTLRHLLGLTGTAL